MTLATNSQMPHGNRKHLRHGVFRVLCFRIYGFRAKRKSMPFFGAGFTLIELLVSLAVVGVVAGILWEGMFFFRASYELNQSVGIALGFLKDAHARALASERAKQWGVHFEETEMVLFQGSPYSAANAVDRFSIPSAVHIADIQLAGGGSDAVFERLTGSTAQAGTVVFESRRTAMQKTVRIFDSGISGEE